MDTGLRDKVAIVTGGSGGIGLACGASLVAEGARVAIGDLPGERLERAVAGLGGPERAHGVAVDVTRPEDATRLVSDTVARFGRLDILVAAAGIYRATRLDEITPEEWDQVLAVNLRGAFLTVQAALRELVPRRSGRIVLIASLGGQTGGLAASAAYASSKGAVQTLAKSVARYAGPHGITANCVNPGIIDTAMTAGWAPKTKERLVASTPVGRLGTPEDVAAVVTFLASDAASFVHGAHVDINGGLQMY